MAIDVVIAEGVYLAATRTQIASTSTIDAREGNAQESAGGTKKEGRRGFDAGGLTTGACGTGTVVLDTVFRAYAPG